MSYNRYGAYFLAAAFGILPSQSLAGDLYIAKKSVPLNQSAGLKQVASVSTAGNYPFDERGLWTGFSAGLNLIGQRNITVPNENNTDYDSSKSNSASVFRLGAGLGSDHQIGDFVVGVNSNIAGGYSQNEISVAQKDPADSTRNINAYAVDGNIMLRAGYSVESILFYGEGGMSGTGMFNISSKATDKDGRNVDDKSDDITKVKFDSNYSYGPVIGGGLQYMLDNNMSVGASYHYSPNSLGLKGEKTGSGTDSDVKTKEITNAGFNKHKVALSVRYHF